MLQIFDRSRQKEMQAWIAMRGQGMKETIVRQAAGIMETVRRDKDSALFAYTKQFDHVGLSSLTVDKKTMEHALQKVDPLFLEALQEAKENIIRFHEAQYKQGYELKEKDNVYLGQRILPYQRVGVYVPGGSAAYPSSVLMNVLPARIAGVKEIIMVTPPNKNGTMDPNIAAAAMLAEVDQIYTIGGAQAIAALTYGTESIPKVDKIVGPGNAYVAAAKRLAFGQVDIDMIAGPSEILIIADAGANPAFVAADLISQAEHDPMASAILLTIDPTLAKQVQNEVNKQAKALPRKAIITQSMQAFGAIMILETMEECIDIANELAPEHLELMVEDSKQYLDQIRNAGSIFLGYMSCEAIGDYFGGTNHVLPTGGTARFASALNVDSFTKKSSYLYWSEEALQKHGEKIIRIAQAEQLEGHANAVKVRLGK